MEDDGVMSSCAVSEIQEKCEQFKNVEDIELCNDHFNESSDCSDTDDDDNEEDFCSDEVVKNSYDVNDEHTFIE